jgi:hypothetical protein
MLEIVEDEQLALCSSGRSSLVFTSSSDDSATPSDSATAWTMSARADVGEADEEHPVWEVGVDFGRLDCQPAC